MVDCGTAADLLCEESLPPLKISRSGWGRKQQEVAPKESRVGGRPDDYVVAAILHLTVEPSEEKVCPVAE